MRWTLRLSAGLMLAAALIVPGARAQQPVAGVTASTSGSSSEGRPAVDERYRRYAASLLKHYDKNQNGQLERDEWSQMRGDWNGADLNGDGNLSADEVAERFASYGRRRGGASRRETSASSSPPTGASSPTPAASSSTTAAMSPAPASSSPPSASSSSVVSPSTPTASPAATPAASPARKAYRFLTPAERLPAGLPDWFARKDADGDGQVSMAEFCNPPTEDGAQEFAGYDANGDGLITAKECQAAGR